MSAGRALSVMALCFAAARVAHGRAVARLAWLPLATRPRAAPGRGARALASSAAPGLDAAGPAADASAAAADAPLRSRFLTTMRERGFLHQCTDLEGLDGALADAEAGAPGADGAAPRVVSAYLGFDATASSLHVGSLLQIMILRHFQACGHRPVVLVGGGTTKVGDPSGKDESRVMLTPEAINQNIAGVAGVFERFLEFAPGHGAAAAAAGEAPDAARGANDGALLLNNDAWLASLNYLEFLRDYGPHFSVNRMLAMDSVKLRLEREQPLSFLEFNYMLLQAYDFVELHRRHGVTLQLGGSDQWGNIISGVELGRRVDQAGLYGLTAPLITTADGKKMGKTAAGAVWLNADRLAPYDYWQFWRNTADADVGRFLRLFTMLPLERCAELEALKGAEINAAKAVLADEATRLLHGDACLDEIRATAATLFAGAAAKDNSALPRVEVAAGELDGGEAALGVVDLYVRLGFAKSKSEARRLIEGGGARVNDEKVSDVNARVADAMFVAADGGDAPKRELKLSSGKKKHGIVELVP